MSALTVDDAIQAATEIAKACAMDGQEVLEEFVDALVAFAKRRMTAILGSYKAN